MHARTHAQTLLPPCPSEKRKKVTLSCPSSDVSGKNSFQPPASLPQTYHLPLLPRLVQSGGGGERIRGG